MILPPSPVPLGAKNIGQGGEFQNFSPSISGLPAQKNVFTLYMESVIVNPRYLHVQLHETAGNLFELLAGLGNNNAWGDENDEKRRTKSIQRPTFPRLAKILNRIP